ncbi:DUF1775 domain-containing protein [Paenibacillaceae bacterium]|nr:DUF1775 domain-containing protein [Paenibacillaceae bacterium]
MKRWIVSGMTALAMLLFAGVASAHVTVSPNEVKQGSYEVFTVRVPSETAGTSTVSVKVTIPEGAAVSRTEPKPGWTEELELDDKEQIVSVTWKADGDGLSQKQFTEFRMQGKVADDATELVWKAYQTYADGSLVEWIGGDNPASVTTVTAGTGESDGHGHQASPADSGSGTEAGNENSGSMATWLSALALALAAVALVTALLRGRKR